MPVHQGYKNALTWALRAFEKSTRLERKWNETLERQSEDLFRIIESPHETNRDLHNALRVCLSQYFAGFWIFVSDKGQMKRSLQAVLDDPRYNLEDLAYEQLADYYRAEGDEKPLQVFKERMRAQIAEKDRALQEKEQRIKRLEEALREEKEMNHRLREGLEAMGNLELEPEPYEKWMHPRCPRRSATVDFSDLLASSPRKLGAL